MSCKTVNPYPYECGPDILISATARPTREKQDFKIKEIRITQLDHGYILEVGCKRIALDTPDKIIFGLKKYFANPENVEHQFLKGAFKFEK